MAKNRSVHQIITPLSLFEFFLGGAGGGGGGRRLK